MVEIAFIEIFLKKSLIMIQKLKLKSVKSDVNFSLPAKILILNWLINYSGQKVTEDYKKQCSELKVKYQANAEVNKVNFN